MRVVIAGGGLTGLTAGVALLRAGHDVVVVERAPAIRAAGSGIGLWRNAITVFERIGLGPQVQHISTIVDTYFFDPAGRRLRAEGFTAEDHQLVLIPRGALNDLLAAAIGASRIRLGAAVTGFDEGPDGVAVRLSTGEVLSADLLIGADGVHSSVRAHLVPGSEPVPHGGHHAWRALVPAGRERHRSTVVTIGHQRTRGGYSRISGARTMWMVNQFDCPPLTGAKREQALERAHRLNDGGWQDDLLRLIESTPEEDILFNPVLIVPELPAWTAAHTVLIGDAAHALSPHISAGGNLGIEDVGVLVSWLSREPELSSALHEYEKARRLRFDRVRQFSAQIEAADGAAEFAERYATFSHWMLASGPDAYPG
ncbi:NAD(P)/FAD-dependent oxidoreductase [Actinoplanes sp. N902-109]|uniref:FAD-dependent oxidoreductase n=1 Tax=Actinoplanes sp. (strain N902-109) TaxID=649831 RepID=UPI0003294C4A|nr:FAD-dependent monooxygenase [Actinoplanes sp. N902-109]AGL12192.1 FAD binding domain protein [Actinoplanes sp. N902-109]AGL16456.1 FAD binding domain protein [Actinoplanes sp. N902-109]